MKKRAALCLIMMGLVLAACGVHSDHFKDGSYVAESKGHHQKTPIRVEVTIAGGNITDVQVLKHEEATEQVPQTKTALENLPGAIVKKNSTAIDGVAGATETSNGIKEAVNKALEQAK